MRRHSIYAAAAVAVMLVPATRADVTWLNPNGGLFSDGANWSTGAPPTALDTAAFDLPATYTVDLGIDHSLLSLNFRRGHVTLNMASRVINQGFQFGPPSNFDVGLMAGDDATATMLGGRIYQRGTSCHLNVGAASGSRGVLELRAGAQLGIFTGAVNVGTGGLGSVLLADASTLNDGGNGTAFNLGAGGLVNVQSGSSLTFGTFTAAGALTASGGSLVRCSQWAVGDTGSLTVSGPGTILGWDNSLGGTGLVRIQDGALAGPFGTSSLVALTNLEVDGAGSTFASPNFIGHAAVTNGALFSPITMGSSSSTTASADLTVSGAGSRATASAVYNSTILITGGATANFRALENSTLVVRGPQSRLEGTSLLLPESGSHSASITLQLGAVLSELDQVRLSGGSRVDVQSGSQVTTPVLQIGNSALSGEALVTVSQDSSLSVGTLGIGSGASAPGRLVLDGLATIGPGGVHIDPSGVLAGSGLVVGGVTNSGRVAPGSPAGILRIAGPYTQTSAGALDIELGGVGAGTGYDQLVTTGASLAGELNISLVSSFIPAMGSTFTILEAEQISGAFSTINLPTLEGGLTFNVVYSFDSVSLVTVPAPGPLMLGAALIVLRRRRR